MDADTFHETKLHGKRTFPYIVYRGNLPAYIRSYGLHWHDEMEIITITSGRGLITVQPERYHVRSGDLLLIPPQTVHSIEQEDGAPMEYFNILFRFSLLCAPGDSCWEKYLRPIAEHTRRFPVFLPADAPLNGQLRPYIDDLTENRRRRYTDHELMVKSDLFAILHLLQPYCGEVNTAARSRWTAQEKLKKVLLFIQEQYPSPITVKEAAKLCSFSPSYFEKLFRELTGTSFTQYLKDYRLEAAAQLLDTGLSVTEASSRSGFDSPSYFTRAFAAKYGMTPSAYRKRPHVQ